jgi:hypothetical protein
MASSESMDRQRKSWVERVSTRMLATIAFVILILSAAGGIALGSLGQSTQNDAAAAKGQLKTAEGKVETGVQLAEANLDFCKDPAVVEVLSQGGYQDVCDLAVEVKTQGAPGEPGEQGQQGDRGPGPTQEQINKAVDEYFRTHPLPEGKSPTVEQVAVAVGDYLRTNPPAPGRPPTPEEVALATAAYLAEHAEEFRGPQGVAGERGPAPSAADVKAAVAAYCGENGDCRGPQGVGVTGTELHRDEQGVCTLYFTLENPANGQTRQIFVQVNDGMCSPVPLLPTGGR